MNRARRSGILAVLGVAAAMLVIVGCGGGAGGGGEGGGDAPTAKIVSDLPLQGANRAQTTTMVNAIKLALQERDNKAGDINIEYESLDDATAQAGQWDAAKCAENAQGAAQDEEVIGWIGPFNSGCAAVEIPILNEAGLAMISPANTYIGLTKPGGESDEPDKYYPTGERNYARVIVADDKQGAAGTALMEEEGLESVYVLDDKETYGKGLADQFQQTAEDAGIEVLGREGIDGSAPNYRSLMNKIAAAQPDAIYFGGIIENNAAQIIKDKVGAGMSNEEVAFIGPDGIFVDELLTQAGDSAEGVWITFGGLPESELSESGQEFVDELREHVRRRDPTLHRLRLRGGQRDARRHRAGLGRGRRRRAGPAGGDGAGLRYRRLRGRPRHLELRRGRRHDAYGAFHTAGRERRVRVPADRRRRGTPPVG